MKFIVLALCLLAVSCTAVKLTKTSRKLEENSTARLEAFVSQARVAAGHVASASSAKEAGNLDAVEKELALAQSALPDPEPGDVSQGAERAALAISDNPADRQRAGELYQKAALRVAEAKALVEKLAAERDRLLTERTALLEKLYAQEHEAKKKAQENAALLKEIVRALLIAGIITAVLAVLAVKFFASLALPCAGLSASFFTLSYLAATIQPWMLYTFLGIVFVVGAAIAIYVIRERRTLDGSVGFIEEMRQENPEWWKNHKEKAREWLGDGKNWLGKHIDKRVTALNLR